MSSAPQEVTPAELASHASPDAAWVSVQGRVYDVSGYARYHPGGSAILLRCAGKDATPAFLRAHPMVPHEILMREWFVGLLQREGAPPVNAPSRERPCPPAPPSATPRPALLPEGWLSCELLWRRPLSEALFTIRCELAPSTCLGLPSAWGGRVLEARLAQRRRSSSCGSALRASIVETADLATSLYVGVTVGAEAAPRCMPTSLSARGEDGCTAERAPAAIFPTSAPHALEFFDAVVERGTQLDSLRPGDGLEVRCRPARLHAGEPEGDAATAASRLRAALPGPAWDIVAEGGLALGDVCLAADGASLTQRASRGERGVPAAWRWHAGRLRAMGLLAVGVGGALSALRCAAAVLETASRSGADGDGALRLRLHIVLAARCGSRGCAAGVAAGASAPPLCSVCDVDATAAVAAPSSGEPSAVAPPGGGCRECSALLAVGAEILALLAEHASRVLAPAGSASGDRAVTLTILSRLPPSSPTGVCAALRALSAEEAASPGRLFARLAAAGRWPAPADDALAILSHADAEATAALEEALREGYYLASHIVAAAVKEG